MINRILNVYLNNLKCRNIPFDESFINAEYENIADLMRIVNLPRRVSGDVYINKNHLPKNLQDLYDDFDSLLDSTHSAFCSVNTYDIVPYIVCMLVEKIYKKCLINDITLPVLLYIDTQSFVSDLSTIISQDRNVGSGNRRLRNSPAIINEYIYSAQFVFWDRFEMNFGEYYENYINEIIKGRYNDCLGNFYFSDEPQHLFEENFTKNSIPILDIKKSYDVIEEQSGNKILLQEDDIQNER